MVTARPSSPVTKQPGILKISPQPQNVNPGGKKSKQPIAFDLGAMIDALEVELQSTLFTDTRHSSGSKIGSLL